MSDGEEWYLITQYIAGQSLETFLVQAPGGYLAEQETIKLGIRLAQLMYTLHTLQPPVIFRDLKPANIIMTPAGDLFLVDFGIARVYTAGKAKDTVPLGSPGYAPPEQYGGTQTDQRSDIYGLGATLQTLLTGRDPLELRAGEQSLNPAAPSRRLQRLLEEMLASQATRRPANMWHAKRRLEWILHRPGIEFFLGASPGGAFSALMLLSFFVLRNTPLQKEIGLLAVGAATVLERLLRVRLKRPARIAKGFHRFWALGLLVGLLPLLIWYLLVVFRF